jgi:heptosyltransferase I
VVVANDSGLAHVAAAVGTPTLMIFGPTPHATLSRLPSNVKVLRAGLPCEPCWFGGARFRACDRRIECLGALSVAQVERETRALHRRSEGVESSIGKVHA